MRASIEKIRNGAVDLHLDLEAARAVLASVLFAARFHDGFAPLAPIAETGLRDLEPSTTLEGIEPCH